MRFVFIRHGHYDKSGPKSGWRHAGLTDGGIGEARRAGEFLQSQQIVPDMVLTTDTQRTRQTAEIILGLLGIDVAVAHQSGFPQTATSVQVEQRIAEWAGLAPAPPTTLLFVGHHTQQQVCLRELGGPRLTRDQRCVLVYDKDAGGSWKCTFCLDGA